MWRLNRYFPECPLAEAVVPFLIKPSYGPINVMSVLQTLLEAKSPVFLLIDSCPNPLLYGNSEAAHIPVCWPVSKTKGSHLLRNHYNLLVSRRNATSVFNFGLRW